LIAEIGSRMLEAIDNLEIDDTALAKKITLKIINTYPKVKLWIILKAIERGAKGEFGRTYKICTQEVFIWIQNVIKENNAQRFL
tara:strand:+ start:1202 stop:1453 length:252 start_codon:yes stop_codon:yes gene_type:complete